MNGIRVHSKGVLLPRNREDPTVAETVDSNKGIMEFMEILKRSISSTNSTPARGALNIHATAAAAPHPRRIVMLL